MSEEINVIRPHVYGLPSDATISPHDLRKYPWIRMYLYEGKKKELKTVIATEEGLQGFIYVDRGTGITVDEFKRPDISYFVQIVRKFPKLVVYRHDILKISGAKYVKVFSWTDFLDYSNNRFRVELESQQSNTILPPSADVLKFIPTKRTGIIPGMSYVSTDDSIYVVLRPHCWRLPGDNHDVVHDLGRIAVRIDPKSQKRDDVSFTNLHDLFGDSNKIHPHIKEHNACFGNVADQIKALLEIRDYTTLGLLFDAFTSEVNIDDSWGSEVSKWPIAIGIRRAKNE